MRLAEEMLGKLKARQRAVLELTYYEGPNSGRDC